MADQVAAITGLPPTEAANFLEMAGGNVEAAVALFFDMGGPMGGGGAPPPPSQSAGSSPQSPEHTLLFGGTPAPPAWLEQGFEFSNDPASRCGLLQGKNGPCGALAVVNAEVIAHLGCPLPSAAVDDETLCAALASILWRCASGGKIVLASYVGDVGGAVSHDEFTVGSAAELGTRLLPKLAIFKGRGGCCLLLYACVLTRGLDNVKRDVALDNGMTPLIIGPNALCGTELVNLMLSGVARGNVAAYGAMGGKVDWRAKGRVGMLSRDELEIGMPLADELKSPLLPVWVMHGGDHFTVAWLPASPKVRYEQRVKALFGALTAKGQPPNDAAAAALAAAAKEIQSAPATPPPATDGVETLDLAMWNGLPPARQLCWLRLRGCGPALGPDGALPAAPAAPPTPTPSHWRMTVGELESVVQVRATLRSLTP